MSHVMEKLPVRDEDTSPLDPGAEAARVASLLYRINERGIRLWVEDGSRLKYKLLRKLPDKAHWLGQLKENKAEIVEILQASGITSDQQPLPGIYRVGSSSAPLSYAQQRLFFIDEYEQGSRAYNVPITLRLSKDVDLPIFSAALRSVVDRHEVLKSRIGKTETGEAYQHIGDGGLEWSEHRCEDEEELKARLHLDARYPFDLANDLPVRLDFYTLGEDRFALINFHHIAFDGWSIDVLFRELRAFYEQHQGLRPPSLPPLPIQYRDFAIWEKSRREAEVWEKQLAYWQERLQGMEVLELPTDHPRPSSVQYESDRFQTRLDRDLSERLHSLASARRVTPYTLLLGVFNVLLSKYTHQSDLTVGSITANRHHRDVQDLIGFFVNTLVVRNQLDEEASFDDFLSSVSRRVAEAQAHQDVPFEHLVERLEVAREQNRHPLFDVLFTFQNFESDAEDRGLFQLVDSDHYNVAKFDLEFFLSEEPDRCLKLEIRYKTSLYNLDSIEQMARHLAYLSKQIVENPRARLRDLSLLTAEDQAALVHDLNRHNRPFPQTTIHELFAQQAQATPSRTALVCGEKSLDYQQLEERSNRLAHHLRELYQERHGVSLPLESPIALYLDRSLEMFVGLLGILKAGGAYVPIDTEGPEERLSVMLEDAQPVFVLTQTQDQPRLVRAIESLGSGVAVVNLEDEAC